MRILILGYGKMGKAIEQVALERGHTITAKITRSNCSLLDKITSGQVEAAIEFSQPEAAYENIKTCLARQIPVVSGTTGWLQRETEIHNFTKDTKGAFFYASNYSIGVNLFFKLNKILARMMNQYSSYEVELEEIHHKQKKDAPSGTAITLAEDIIEQISRKNKWINERIRGAGTLGIKSLRKDDVPGTHKVVYSSDVDEIEIKHTAHNRRGFALGAVLAAEWLQGKKGVFGMEDFLQF